MPKRQKYLIFFRGGGGGHVHVCSTIFLFADAKFLAELIARLLVGKDTCT